MSNRDQRASLRFVSSDWLSDKLAALLDILLAGMHQYTPARLTRHQIRTARVVVLSFVDVTDRRRHSDVSRPVHGRNYRRDRCSLMHLTLAA